MKKSIILLVFCCLSNFLLMAQNNPMFDLQKPAPSVDMPEWANKLYMDPINVFEVDQAYTDYYNSHPYKKDHYVRYYRRWRKWVQPYISESGKIENWSAQKWETLRTSGEQFHVNNKSANDWKDIGPRSTQWIGNDNALDTFCPWQSNIYAFDVSSSNPSVLYCITETGSLFRTDDKGKNWELKAAGYDLGSEALAVHPADPNTMLIGVNGGVRKTVDGGTTFSTVLTNSGMWVTDIGYNASNPNTVMIATSKGLWRTVDGGTNWTNIISNECLDLEYHPNNSLIVYVLRKNNSGTFYEVWRSGDGGLTFQAKTSGWPTGLTNGVGRLAVTPAAPDRVYAVLLTSDRPRIMKTDNQGNNWTVTAQGETTALEMDNWQGFYDLDIVASPLNANWLIVGTASAYKSTDGGLNFSNLGGYGGKWNLHPDIQEMKAIGNDVYISTDGGMNYSNDFFDKNYSYRTFGITSTDMWGFGSGWNEDILVGGRYHNGNTVWHENYGPQTYLRMGGAESPTGYVNPINNKQTYFSDIGSYIVPDTKEGKVLNQPMSLWPNESYFNMEYSELEWDPRCWNTFYLGNGASLYRTENNGVSFANIFTSPDQDASVQHIEVCRSNSDVIYFSQRSNNPGDGRIRKSIDGGKTWQLLTNLPVSAGQRRVMDISVGGLNDKELWAALLTGSDGGKVFHTADGGISWINWTTPKLNGVRLLSISHQLGTNGGVYIAGDNGRIYYRDKSMNEWQLYNDNLPFNHYCRQLRPFYRDQKMRSAAGNGIWEVGFVNPSMPMAQPSVDKRLSACERDTFYFDDYSVLPYDGSQAWEWSFPGAIYVSSTNVRNPKVAYAAVGDYDVTLTVSNASGSNTRTIAKMVKIESGECGLEPRPGRALSMNGTNKVASIPVNPRLQDAKGLTIMTWIKISDQQQWFTQLISNWGSESQLGFGFAFQGYVPTTNLTFSWKDVPYWLTTAHEVPINVWTHVALTIEPTLATVYMDGKAWTRPGNYIIDLDKTPFVIGNGVPGQGGTFNGSMDEFKIFKRALSQNEIREQMHLIPDVLDSDIVMYYQFNEKNPARIYDKSGTNHATNGDSPFIKSTAAIGPGTSDRLTISTVGTYPMVNTKSELVFATSAAPITPGGEVVLYRIKHAPDTIPSSAIGISPHYWVFRNWGTNASFNGLKEMSLLNTGIMSTNSQLKIRNTAQAEGAIWSTNVIFGSPIPAKPDGDTKFLNGALLIKNSSQWIIQGNKIPLVITASPNQTICDGESVTLTATGGDIYLWTDPNGIIIGNTADINFSPSTSGKYTVSVTDVSGNSDTVQINILINLLPVIDLGPEFATVCPGSFYTTVQLPSDYNYTVNAGCSNTDIGNQFQINVVGPCTFILTATTNKLCSLNDTIYLNNFTVAPTEIAAGLLTPGEDLIMNLTLIFSSYLWNDGSLGSEISINNVGNYSVTTTDANGCIGVDNFLVELDSTALPFILPSLPNPVLGLDNINNSVSYQWYYNGVLISGAKDSTYLPTLTGAYTCFVTYSNGFAAFTPPYNYIKVSVTDWNSGEWTVLPNPTKDVITIKSNHLSSTKDEFQYLIYDTNGKIVFMKKAARNTELDLLNLSAGSYYLLIKTKQKTEALINIIKL